jgi:hypothetical protein
MASEGNPSTSSVANTPRGDPTSGAKSPFTFGPGFSVPLRHPIPPLSELAPPPKLASPAKPDPDPPQSPTPETKLPTSPEPPRQGSDSPVRAGRRKRLLEPYVVTSHPSVLTDCETLALETTILLWAGRSTSTWMEAYTIYRSKCGS